MNEETLRQLERLEELRSRGSLTEEEFAEAKTRVLSAATPVGASPPPPPGPRDGSAGISRDELRRRGLIFKQYPVWLIAALSAITFGIFAYFWMNHWHGIMPKRRPDDPSTARAIGFSFIPFFKIYWGLESLLRLCTRLDEEFAASGLQERAPREVIRWFLILNLVPYLSTLTSPVLGAVAAGTLQSQVNQLARLDRQWWETEMDRLAAREPAALT